MNEANKLPAPILWNPWNKVVQDHRDGTICQALTDLVRRRLGLPTPWTPEMAEAEVHQGGVFLSDRAALASAQEAQG